MVAIIAIIAGMITMFVSGMKKVEEETMNRVSYVLSALLGFVTFRNFGYNIVRMLYSGVPTAEELGGKVYLQLSINALPLLVCIICVLVIILNISGYLGTAIGESLGD